MKSNKMQAIVCTAYGSPDVLQLREVDKPVPRENEVLIKNYAAPVATADTMIRTGKPLFGRLFLGLRKPKNPIPGTGFAGVIEQVGKSVKSFKTGDAVFGETTLGFSTHAAYVCVPEDGVILKKPPGITYEEAAPVCDGALTSLNFLSNIITLHPGQSILINGASGSLGTAAVQLAKYFGAEVTGVCGPTNLALVKSLGADQVIDYTAVDFTKDKKTYDVIFDTVGKLSFSRCKKVLKPEGVYLSPVLGFSLLLQMLRTNLFGTKKAKFSATGLLPVLTLLPMLQTIKELMENGQLKTVIDRHYTLKEIADAHRYVDRGHKKGNVVLRIVE